MTTSAINAASTTAASTSSGKPLISSDFDTFLKMLTAQMQNQDPMKPIDSADYAVQLATFSGVEQQVPEPTSSWQDMAGQVQPVLGMAEAGQLDRARRPRSPAPVSVWMAISRHAMQPNPATSGPIGRCWWCEDSASARSSRVRKSRSKHGLPYQWLGADASTAIRSLPGPIIHRAGKPDSGETGHLGDQPRLNTYCAGDRGAQGGGSTGTKLVLEGGVEVLASDDHRVAGA